VYATKAPASSAAAIWALTYPTIPSPPATLRLPAGSAKSFCTSTTMSAVVAS